MRSYLLGVLLLLGSTVWAQQSKSITDAMDKYDYRTAITLIDQQSPTPELLFLKAKAQKGLYEYNESVKTLQNIITKSSDNQIAILELAECAKLAGQFNLALENYEKVIKLNPEHHYAKIQYVNLLLLLEKYRKAQSVCEEILQNDSSVIFIKQMAQSYEGLLLPLSARDWYLKAVEKEPYDYFSVSKLASMCIQTDNLDLAIQATEKYREKDPDNIYVNRQNAQTYCLAQNYDLAAERYTQLLNQGDSTRMTCYYAGMTFFIKERFYDAHDCLEVALKYDPQNINILFYLAKACARTSWKKEGVEYMQQAIDLTIPTDENLAKLYAGLADCYNRNREFGKYIETLHTQRKYEPKKNYLLYSIGAAYQDYMKDEKNAVKYLEMYLKTRPQESDDSSSQMEGGMLVLDDKASYRAAESRLRTIKQETFFRDGVKEEETKK